MYNPLRTEVFFLQIPTTLPPILTQTEVADFLRISSKTVAEMRARGQIRYFRAGGAIRFRREDVLAVSEPSGD